MSLAHARDARVGAGPEAALPPWRIGRRGGRRRTPNVQLRGGYAFARCRAPAGCQAQWPTRAQMRGPGAGVSAPHSESVCIDVDESLVLYARGGGAALGVPWRQKGPIARPHFAAGGHQHWQQGDTRRRCHRSRRASGGRPRVSRMSRAGLAAPASGEVPCVTRHRWPSPLSGLPQCVVPWWKWCSIASALGSPGARTDREPRPELARSVGTFAVDGHRRAGQEGSGSAPAWNGPPLHPMGGRHVLPPARLQRNATRGARRR